MRQVIESLFRLYKSELIDKQKIDSLFTSKKINQQEYDYIISAKEEV
jgi:hypothetical protein